MLIVSKFHDYYDSAMGMGIDKTCVYKRETKAIPFKIRGGWKEGRENPISGLFNERARYSAGGWNTARYVIGFCGKLYPLIHISRLDVKGLTDEHHYFYDEESYNTFFKVKKDKKKSKWRSYFWWHREPQYFFNADIWKGCIKYFDEYKCPIFILRKNDTRGADADIVLNPELKQYRFMTQVDSYTAFQEIYMYMSGVLGSDMPKMVEISDEIRAHKRGFNKWSFRTPPTKKK